MQRYIDKNTATYLAERERYIREVVKRWKFEHDRGARPV
jgi:hypothetical protein